MTTQKSARRMNVLQVISDQHQAACVGVEGHPQAITPHMDGLARDGVRFANAYTQNPICTPSRTSILSGQYCHNHGVYGLCGPYPPMLPSFLQHFRAHGYRTAGIGKLHTPDDPRDWLLDHCDLFAECYEYGGRSQKSPYYAYLQERGLLEKEDSTRLPEFPGGQQDEGRPSWLPYAHSVEGWCVQRAIQFMDESRVADRPFCMQVSLPRPHQCYTPDRKFWDMYPDDLALPPAVNQEPSHRPPHFRRMVEEARCWEGLIEPKGMEHVRRRVWRAYLACITQVDYALGQLLDHLARTGLAENTIVIYHSDHGAYSGTFGVPEKAPGICSEAVCRVPMIWRVPGLTSAGHVSSHLVENIDLAATLPGLCGLPAMETTDGCDIAGLLRGENCPVREVAVTENCWSKALRWGPWRFVHYQPKTFGGQDIGELYHLENDPLETRNLYHDPACRDIVEQGRRRLLEWLIDTTRVVAVWPPPHYPKMEHSLAADGKEANTTGPILRARAGHLNYL